MHPGATSVRVNGQLADGTPQPGGYFQVQRLWKPGDVVELSMDFAPVLLEANPLVEETTNQVAIKYGPLVYCLEGDDLPKGVKMSDIALSLFSKPPVFQLQPETIANAKLFTLSTTGLDLQRKTWSDATLYRETSNSKPREVRIKLIPYYAWGNRTDSDMTVWLPSH
jgi:DUF1680 family protein